MQTFASCLAVLLGAALALPGTRAGELIGPGPVSSDLQETSVAMTPDGRTMYFMRSDFAERDDTILVSHRHGDRWSTPEIAAFSGRWHDSEPTLSPDGRRLYFVSNRPLVPGGEALIAHMRGHRFAGKNLWYVERRHDGRWGAPVHVAGALNDGAMLYNPSVARSGAIYFSAHRADSGAAYQIYMVRPNADGYGAPERLELGDLARNRMDPAIDPDERFIVYAGNEGDSAGSADLYIAFRGSNGHWGHPQRLPDGINSPDLENAPSLGPHFGELFASSSRRGEVAFPRARSGYAALQQTLHAPLNGSRNLWRFDMADVLRAHGIDH